MKNIYSYALFVDLPNFYSRLLNSNLGDARFLRDYFLYWLDFDRLGKEIGGVISPTWVFYSSRRFGPSGNRIENQYLNDYIQRINSLRGTTAKNVNIPGDQREPASYHCEECGHQGIAQWESEKGIDSSLTVHLFDTIDTWDIAFLLSGDADFVPAVASLRRRGKIIVGAGFSDVSSALVRECYDYLDLNQTFLVDDIVGYALFKNGGILHKWLTEPINSERQAIRMSVAWKSVEDLSHSPNSVNEYFSILLQADGSIDLTSRIQLLRDLDNQFPGFIKEFPEEGNRIKCALRINLLAWEGIKRRLNIITSIENLNGPISYSGGYVAYELNFRRNEQSNEFEVVEA